MLIQIDIENVAVIERASIEFDKGLNVITGETEQVNLCSLALSIWYWADALPVIL